eukprot:364853-Chlamydomonas_euryale.AAC.8
MEWYQLGSVKRVQSSVAIPSNCPVPCRTTTAVAADAGRGGERREVVMSAYGACPVIRCNSHRLPRALWQRTTATAEICVWGGKTGGWGGQVWSSGPGGVCGGAEWEDKGLGGILLAW